MIPFYTSRIFILLCDLCATFALDYVGLNELSQPGFCKLRIDHSQDLVLVILEGPRHRHLNILAADI